MNLSRCWRLSACASPRRSTAQGYSGDRSREPHTAPRTDAEWNLDAFARMVRDGTPPPITGEDGLRALDLMLSCYRSAETGVEVAIGGPMAQDPAG